MSLFFGVRAGRDAGAKGDRDMVWDRLGGKWTSTKHRERGRKLSAAYKGPAGLPSPREGQIPGHWKSPPTGNRGGAPIWVMAEAWRPKNSRLDAFRRLSRTSYQKRGGEQQDGREMVDPDGFAVFGRFPKGWLEHVLRLQLLGDVGRDDILHVASGTLGPSERWTVDIRPEAKPRIVADGTKLPVRDASFKAVLIDPPYSDEYARNLYGVDNPRPSWLLREAARVVVPGGRIGLLHVAVPFAPPGCRLLKVYGVSCGVGFRIRAFTVFERNQDSLL